MKKYLTPYNLLLMFVLLLNVFAYLAPIFMHVGLEGIAKYIYFVYSFFCHQLHYRSLHIFDYQVAWCTRDAFIWFGLLASGIAFKFVKTKPVRWYEIILFIIPIALDGGIQLVATMFGLGQEGHEVLYSSTNLTRMLTGSILGIGLGMWIFPSLKEFETYKTATRVKEVAKIKLFSVLLILLSIFYIMLVSVWNLTSEEYKPENMLDSNVKLPENDEEWFLRRQNGYCPRGVDESAVFIFDCEE
ncbi:DUF2085 domain-containing protein [Candidatus Dojkabacteria bacterium]|nr:DUF2085 domain-containing protein [Candidatus Dojkabacteria bacterium]